MDSPMGRDDLCVFAGFIGEITRLRLHLEQRERS
jgi:hypothetical protein